MKLAGAIKEEFWVTTLCSIKTKNKDCLMLLGVLGQKGKRSHNSV